MKRKTFRISAALLALAMLLTLLPATAKAAGESGIQLGTGGLGAGDEVYFGDYTVSGTTYDVPWVVLRSSVLYQTSVAPGANVLPLLSKYTLGSSKFRSVAIDYGYYDANLALDANTGSVLKATMDGLYSGSGTTLFSNSERGTIVETTLQRDSMHLNKGNDVNARLFPLSDDEMSKLGSIDLRKAADISSPATNVKWWLRFCDIGKMACFGSVGGDIGAGRTNQLQELYGVRPAFHLDKNAVLFSSAATGGKASGTVGAGALNPNLTPSGTTAWKLTLDDSASRTGFNVTTNAVSTTTAGGNVSIAYSGAEYGTNEFLSAMITSGSGTSETVLYYGRLKSIALPADASGTQAVTIPALTAGTYSLKVFNEEYNGEKNTDYASAFKNVTLTVATGPTVATPTFSPAAGSYTTAQSVAISCATTGTTIRYTTDGTDPTAISTPYSSAINVSATTTIKAKAFKAGMTASSTASATYTFASAPIVLPVTVSPAATFAQGNASELVVTIGAGSASFNATNNYDGIDPTSELTPALGRVGAPGADGKVEDGSIVITLRQSYLNTLAPGAYWLRVKLKGGSGLPAYVETRIVVTAPGAGGAVGDADVPKTGDGSMPLLWIGMLLLTGAGLCCKRRARHH